MKIALFVLALVLPTAASGMLFKWTDSKGIAHFTNKEYEIPDRYRAKARRLYPEQADTAPQQNQPAQQPPNPETRTPTLQVSPDAQIRPQPPAVTSEQQQHIVRPSRGRRGRSTVLNPPEE